MKQYRITSADLTTDSPDDCYLAPDDPIQELKIAAYMGGLGAAARLAEYNASKTPVFSDNRGTIQREQQIRPGTPEWFALWRPNPNNN
jgi:hypothetical protein